MQTVLLIFSIELEISGVVVQRIHQNSKKCRLLHSENDFEAVLADFCYGCGANAFEAVKKIATDQKDYHNAPGVLQHSHKKRKDSLETRTVFS